MKKLLFIVLGWILICGFLLLGYLIDQKLKPKIVKVPTSFGDLIIVELAPEEANKKIEDGFNKETQRFYKITSESDLRIGFENNKQEFYFLTTKK